VFELDEWGQSFVVAAYVERVPEHLRAQVDEAIASCPQDAIAYLNADVAG
jgi:ferredoxin